MKELPPFFALSVTVFSLAFLGCSNHEDCLQTKSAHVLIDDIELDDGNSAFLRREIEFRVAGRRPVRIENIKTSCSCANLAEDLVGQSYDPGQSFVVPLQLSFGTHSIGENTANVTIETTAGLKIIRFTCFVSSRPSVRPQKNVLIYQLGRAVEPFELFASWHRLATEEQLELDESASQLKPFRITEASSSSEVQNNSLKSILDRIHFVLEPEKEASPAPGEYELVLAWKSGHESKCTVTVPEDNLLDVGIDRLWVGEHDAGNKTIVEVPVRIFGKIRLVAESNVEKVERDYSAPTSDLIPIAYLPPNDAGEFTCDVSVKAIGQSGRSQQYKLILRGIVR